MMNLAPSLQWNAPDAVPASEASLLLASFAAFYEELASIKRCQHDGVLARYLAPDQLDPPLSDTEFATRASARLLAQLREQHLAFQRRGSAQQIRLHQTALYVMAAMADEILLLELHWPGADHWLPVLLERQMFSTSHSGLLFFQLADKLIAGAGRDPLHADLASVFLLALRLGFKGQHRNPEGEARLDHYRQQLLRIAGTGQARAQPAAPGFFQQAYQHNITDGKDMRLAPLSAWRKAARAAAIGYLILSSAVWAALVYPLDQLFRP
ncbi:DotU family type IV/VI secretion system protein [Massilia sp. SM-13]|uniref:DotU family type IV/VI secretion system protein n=1 Tax=Pseudoduganella rhizocola TaxID=3382643 RepID=UPI0038B5986A